MGLNVDVTKMLGIESTVICPKCKSVVHTQFEDYDIECGDPNPSPGKWELHVYCDNCEYEGKMIINLTPKFAGFKAYK